MERLKRPFYERDTLVVARELLGQNLVRCLNGQRLVGRIVEVEAYLGPGDKASHAAAGHTERNAAMYGPPGHAYIYFIYGMHYCLNVVTDRPGFPAAVLLRALEPLAGIEQMQLNRPRRAGLELTNGPAKLCYALAIDGTLNGSDLIDGSVLWLETGMAIQGSQIMAGPRVGVRGDERALNAPWRFWIAGNPYVSKA